MKIDEIKDMILEDQKKVKDLNSLNDLKVKYLGKKGLISELNQEIRNIPNEEKKDFGKKVNELKNIFNDFYESKKNELETINLNEKLKSEAIDISLPAYNIKVGAPNILEKLIEEVESVCMSMGYDVVDGPEIEEDKYNFEMLNIPKGHPARDAQDTFYLEGEEILLRSQTSPVQVRTMLKGKGKVPIRMICPGKTYRRDDDVNIGDEWSYYNELNGEIAKKEYAVSVGDSLNFYSRYTESDKDPDVGEASQTYVVTEEDLQNGFSVTMDLYVTENGGRNNGKSAHFVVTYTFSAK